MPATPMATGTQESGIPVTGGTATATAKAAATSTQQGETPPATTETPSGSITKVQIIEKSYAILSSRSVVPAGQVEFDLSNMADIQHEFVIFKTDLAGNNLPVSNGQVDEKSSKLTKIDEQDKYPGGETRTLTENLDPGHYVLICNLPDHYNQGMYLDFTVVGPGQSQSTQNVTLASQSSNTTSKVQVIEKSYAIMASKSIVPAGKIEFDLSNMADIQHEFVIFKTDLAGNNLPVSNGQVDEKSSKLTKIDEQDKYPGGETRTLTENLDPGHYVLICNLVGHYQQGMYFNFTVAGSSQAGTQTSQNATPMATGTQESGIPATGATAIATQQAETSSGSVTKVQIIEKSYAILSSRSVVPAGKVEFDLSNMADIQHEFVIFKTDLAGDNLPTKNGQVDENSSKLTKIDEQDKYPGGETRTLTENLDPGHYVLICNLPDHYNQGMYFDLTVESNSQ